MPKSPDRFLYRYGQAAANGLMVVTMGAHMVADRHYPLLFSPSATQQTEHTLVITPTPPTVVFGRTPTPSGEKLKELTPPTQTYEQVIKDEVIRLGIPPNPAEVALWQKGFQAGTHESSLQVGEQRVRDTLALMIQSKNPFLVTAAKDYENFEAQGKVSFSVGEGQKSFDRGALTSPQLRHNGIHAHIDFATNTILNNIDASGLALLLAHEMEHVRNIHKFDATLPSSLPLLDRLFRHTIRATNTQDVIEEEARGNGIQIQAFLYDIALRETSLEGNDYYLIPHAASFIQCGGAMENDCWKEHVEKYLIRS